MHICRVCICSKCTYNSVYKCRYNVRMHYRYRVIQLTLSPFNFPRLHIQIPVPFIILYHTLYQFFVGTHIWVHITKYFNWYSNIIKLITFKGLQVYVVRVGLLMQKNEIGVSFANYNIYFAFVIKNKEWQKFLQKIPVYIKISMIIM